MADSASPREGFTGQRPDTGKDNPDDKGAGAPDVASGFWREAWCGSFIDKAGRRVGEPSSIETTRRRTASVEHGTRSRNLRQQAGA